MKKTWKFIKRCLKYTLIFLIVLIILWVLGILNYILGFFSFLPSINWGPQIIINSPSDTPNEELKKSGNLEAENLTTILPTQKLSTETPKSTSTPHVTSTSAVATVTPINTSTNLLTTPTITSTQTVSLTTSPTVVPTPTYAPTNTPVPTIKITNTPNVEYVNSASEIAFEYTNMFSTVIYTAPPTNTTPYVIGNASTTEKPTPTPEITLATLPPVQPKSIVTSCSRVLFVDLTDELISTLVSTKNVEMPGLTILYDSQRIYITPDDEKALVSFNITKSSFASLYKHEIYSILIPHRNIQLGDIYQQLRETNTDIAEIVWFYDNGEYKCKAVIKKNFLDWLFRFPHDERYIIIE